MPKTNGITKTYSFKKDVVEKMLYLCESEDRTQTNLIEFLINKYYAEKKGL